MTSIERWLKNKLVKKMNGIPLVYIVYEPQKPEPNVITHYVHPDIRNNKELDELLKKVADKTREFYASNTGLLEEILKQVNK